MVLNSESAMDAVLFGAPSQTTVNFFKDKVKNLSSYVGTGMEWIKNQATNMFNTFYSDSAIREAQNILRNTSNQFRDDIIHRVSMDAYSPNLITQRYIMACPEVWERNVRDMTNNFGGTYLDLEPDVKDITQRDDYIVVMNDMLQFDKNGDGYVLHYVTSHDLEELSLEDRLTIMDNWEVARAMLEDSKDPTDI